MMQTYFSFERELWPKAENAELVFCRFKRFHDGPVVKTGPSGSPDEHRIDSINVIHDGERFTMWYIGLRPPPEDIWHMEHCQNLCVAYSDDGVEWQKPDLKLSDAKTGPSPNNVLPGLSHDFYGCGIMRETDRYVMNYYHPRGLSVDEPQTTFSIFTSKDGLHWEGKRKPCIDIQHFEPGNDIFRHKGYYWVMGQGISPYYHMPDGRRIGRVIFAYRSRDLKTWTRVKIPAYAYPIPKYFPEASVQVHCGPNVWDRGRVLLGFLGQFWPAGFSQLVRSTFGLVYSYNAKDWTEPFPAEPLLLPDEQGWDNGMLFQGNGAYSKGEHTYYWYTGLNGGNLWTPQGSAGVCRIRRDGFTYFTAERSATARLGTNKINLPNTAHHVYVNAHATVASPIRIVARDDRTGRELGNRTLSKGGVRVPVLELPKPSAGRRAIRLTFELKNKARLYGFYVGPGPDDVEPLGVWSNV